ncbi:polysaccharide deacetylase family protein [Actinorugispora endophytica]|uniref:Peptidoglycan/xylan/chitin deacetylase (PgdA/CDA1 family) n=1 Tax=Actinorugispora endophytica TaxID=1605990 RepID=A0A4R6V4G0_9ACTN|nr:polysaccharide deacetylase family protein [Actinorugispora endophytica]TDQ55154.1 peptidoglycan/xylan/chitin deacetylase (PgdA/CDA1 family) [Actinorugispora endophytica]
MSRLRRGLITATVLLVSLALVLLGTNTLMNSRTFQLTGEIVHRVDTDDRVVALTFDDGPTEHAEEVVRTLDGLGVRATFYVTGRELEENPRMGALIAEAGHELGNHTYSHQRMVFRSADFTTSEIERTDAAIRETGYSGEITFRPPNGKKLYILPSYLAEHDRTTVTWDVEPDSAEVSDAGTIAEATVRQVRPGSIVLLHPMYDARTPTRDALSSIVESLTADGYRFVTVSELLALRPSR